MVVGRTEAEARREMIELLRRPPVPTLTATPAALPGGESDTDVEADDAASNGNVGAHSAHSAQSSVGQKAEKEVRCFEVL